MLRAVKECMKNWLITHERLYWCIVIGLAVFFFGLITAIGCGKLEKANAAIGGVAPELYEIDFGDDLEFVKEQVSKYDSFAVVRYDRNNWWSYVFWNQSELLDIRGYNVYDSGSYWLIGGFFSFSIDRNTNKMLSYIDGDSVSPITSIEARTLEEYVGSNCDLVFHNNVREEAKSALVNTGLPYPSFEKQPEYVYSPTAPYVGFDSLTISNIFGTGNVNYGFRLDTGFEFLDDAINYILDNHLDYNDLVKQGLKHSYWQYNGRINNLIGFSPDGLKLQMNFTVELPTREYVLDWVRKCSDGNLMDYDMALKTLSASVTEWLVEGGEKNVYEFPYLFEPDVAEDGSFSVSLTYGEIYDLICYFYPEVFREFKGDGFPYHLIRAMWLSYMHIEQTNALVYVPVNGTTYYGRSIMNFYSKGVVNKAVTAEVLVDLRNATEEEINEAIKKAIEKGYSDALKDANDALGDAENELEGIYGVDSAFGDLEGSDLWTGFKGLVNGFAGSIPAIQSLSLLMGAVFAFLPLQVAGVMKFTLLALCIVAIYKAVRG